jgi:predicted transcriptional regulator
VTTRPATRVLMALEPAFYDLMWARAKRHEFRRRFLTGTPVSWLVFLNAPTSALAAVIDLAPAIVDEPRRVADLAERARTGNGASVYAYLRDQSHGYAMPITRVREYPALPLLVLREQNLDFEQPRGYTVVDADSPLASIYDTFTANPPLRELTLERTSDGSIIYG